MTFSFPTKEEKADPWKILYQRLGPLDIKVSKKYHVGVTTHLAASKRNTSKGLQALIDGKYIVHADSYVNALEIATIPDNDDFSPLEKDFEGNFPDPLDHLPPRGEEPTQRDSSAYAPLASRRNMFEGYKFIFYEERQYLNLYAPIEEGGGKVLLEVAKPNQTQVDDFVRYVKTVAGDTGLGEFEDGSVGKGVVVVRFNPVKGAGTDWFAEFGREVSLRLGQRLIEQNEFLDAILGSDASVLRRPLEVEMSGISTLPPPDGMYCLCLFLFLFRSLINSPKHLLSSPKSFLSHSQLQARHLCWKPMQNLSGEGGPVDCPFSVSKGSTTTTMKNLEPLQLHSRIP